MIKRKLMSVLVCLVIICSITLIFVSSADKPLVSDKEMHKNKYQTIDTEYVTFELPKTATHYWNPSGDDIYEVIVHNLTVKGDSSNILKFTWEDKRYINEVHQIHYAAYDGEIDVSSIEMVPLEIYDKNCLENIPDKVKDYSKDKTKNKADKKNYYDSELKKCKKSGKTTKLKFKKLDIQVGTFLYYETKEEFNESCFYDGTEHKEGDCMVDVFYPIYEWNDFDKININISQKDFLAIDDINVSACGTLNVANTTYNQNANLSVSSSYCIIIASNNITYNGAGYTITSDSAYAINSDYNNTVVTGVTAVLTVSGGVDYFGDRGCYYGGIRSMIFPGEVITYGLDIYGINSSIYNNTVRGYDYGIIANAVGSKIYNNTIYESNNYGITGRNITNNIVYDCRAAIILGDNRVAYNNIISDSLGGICNAGDNNKIYNNNITNTTVAIGSTSYSSSGNIYSNSLINYTSYGLYFQSTNNHTVYSNSMTPVNNSVYDIGVKASSTDIFLINMSYNISNENVGSNSNMTRKWYFDYYVNDSSGNAVSGANLTAYDSSVNIEFTELTNATGNINQTSLIEYVNIGGVRTYLTPHLVNITKVGTDGATSSYNLSLENNINNFSTLDFSIDVNIIEPVSEYSYSYNESILLNYSITNYSAIDTCWYNVWDGSAYTISNTTIASCTNISFDVPLSDNYRVTIFINETGGNTASDNNWFKVTLNNPAINVYNPTDGEYLNSNSVLLNFTATDPDGIDWCLAINFGHPNLYNWTTVINDTYTNGTANNVPEGDLDLLMQCWDNFGNEGWTYSFITAYVDTIVPVTNITSISNQIITVATQTTNFDLNYIITDTNLDTYTYNIYNGTDYIYASNQTLNGSGTNSTGMQVVGYLDYTIYIYATDLAGWISTDNISFGTTPATPAITGGSGGDTPIIVIGVNSTWSAKTDTGGNVYDFVMSLGGFRTKGIIYTNMGDYDIILDISCDDITENLCKYVTLSETSVLLKPGEVKGITFTLQLPDETGRIEGITEQSFLNEGKYDVNILAINKEDQSQASLLVRARVGTYGIFSWVIQQITGTTLLPFLDFEIFNFFLLLFPFLTVTPFLYYFVLRNIKTKFPLTFMLTFMVSLIILIIL